MKKLLVLFIVFGMAAVANASIMSISVEGDYGVEEYTLDELECVKLDVGVDDGVTAFIGTDVSLKVEGPGSLNVSEIVLADEYYNSAMGGMIAWTSGPPKLVGSPTSQQVDLTMFTSDNAMFAGAGPFGVADNINFCCGGLGEVVVTLYADLVNANGETQYGMVLDTLLIHQVPEPMTIALLGLGGLALIRRRRA